MVGPFYGPKTKTGVVLAVTFQSSFLIRTTWLTPGMASIA
jgi:hypothetical protein